MAGFVVEVDQVVDVVVDDVLVGKVIFNLNLCQLPGEIIKAARSHNEGTDIYLGTECEALHTVSKIPGVQRDAVTLQILVVITPGYQETVRTQLRLLLSNIYINILVLLSYGEQSPLDTDGLDEIREGGGHQVVDLLRRQVGSAQQPVSPVILPVLILHSQQVLGGETNHGSRVVLLFVLGGPSDRVVLHIGRDDPASVVQEYGAAQDFKQIFRYFPSHSFHNTDSELALVWVGFLLETHLVNMGWKTQKEEIEHRRNI